MEMTVSILVFLTIITSFFGISRWRSEQKQSISKRLDNLVKVPGENDYGSERKSGVDIYKVLSVVGKSFTGLSFTAKLENNLDKADILLKVEEFIGLNIIMALGGSLLGFIFSGGQSRFTLLGFVLVALIPSVFIHLQKKKREALLSEEIGESLTGMSNSLRAGFSFQQAMDLVSKETQGPLGKEYRRTLREINLGVTTDQALQNLINRVQNDDLELMISSVLIQRSIGGNLAEIFDKIADTIRQRIRMKGEVRVLTAQGKVSAWIIGLMPLALILIISMFNPEFLGMFFETTVGLILLASAAVSEIIGFIIVNKIVNIEF